MDILEGIKRIKKGLEKESDPDIVKDAKAVISGMSNFYFGLKTTLAIERFDKFCKDC